MTGVWVIFWVNAGPVGGLIAVALLWRLADLTHPLARLAAAWRAMCKAVDGLVLRLAAEPVGPSRAAAEYPRLDPGPGRHRLDGLRPPGEGR